MICSGATLGAQLHLCTKAGPEDWRVLLERCPFQMLTPTQPPMSGSQAGALPHAQFCLLQCVSPQPPRRGWSRSTLHPLLKHQEQCRAAGRDRVRGRELVTGSGGEGGLQEGMGLRHIYLPQVYSVFDIWSLCSPMVQPGHSVGQGKLQLWALLSEGLTAAAARKRSVFQRRRGS